MDRIALIAPLLLILTNVPEARAQTDTGQPAPLSDKERVKAAVDGQIRILRGHDPERLLDAIYGLHQTVVEKGVSREQLQEAKEALADLIESNPDHTVKMRSTYALGAIASKSDGPAAPVLIRTLAGGKDPYLREAAAFALSWTDKRAADAAAAALESARTGDRDGMVRYEASRSLRKLGRAASMDRAVAELVDFFARTGDAGRKFGARMTLRHLAATEEIPGLVPALLAALRDRGSDPAVRYEILGVLERSEAQSKDSLLKARAGAQATQTDDPDAEVRERCARTLEILEALLGPKS